MKIENNYCQDLLGITQNHSLSMPKSKSYARINLHMLRSKNYHTRLNPNMSRSITYARKRKGNICKKRR